MGGRVGEWAGTDSAKLKKTLGDCRTGVAEGTNFSG